MEWPSTFEEILEQHLPLANGDIEPDAVLADLGLDSLGTVSLIVELEESLDISIPDKVLVVTNFGTAEALWTAVSDLMKERARS